MPDLDIVTAFTCSTNQYWRKEVPASGNGIHIVEWKSQPPNANVQYDWKCTCKGFQFRGKCKHIETAKEERCGWNETLEPTAQPDSGAPDNRPICPECGADVIPIQVGV